MTVIDYEKELQFRDAKIAALEAIIKELRETIKWQQAKYEALERRVFGSSSERLTQQDLQTFFPSMQDQPGNTYKAPIVEPISGSTRTKQPLEKAGGVRANIPDHIERVEVVLVPEQVAANPDAYQKIGEEVTERLDYKPGKIICKRYVQPKYKKIATPNEIIQQTPPPTVVDKCLAEPGLVAYVILCKYDLHLPNYRLSKHFREAFGIDLHRNQLGDWCSFSHKLRESSLCLC